MTKRQRVGYLLSEWTVAYLLVYGLLVLTIVLMSEQNSFAFALSLGLFFAMFVPLVLMKRRAIQKSKIRVDETALRAAAGKMG